MYYTKKNLPKHEPKTDCFAYGEKSKACQALRELVCENEGKCPFYKHRSQVDIIEIENDIKNYGGPKT